MKTATKAAFALFSLVTGCSGLAAWQPAFRERDRYEAADRELARIVGETDQDRRDAEIVASLVGGR